MDELTKRGDKHNNTIQSIYYLGEQVALQEEKINGANFRIEGCSTGYILYFLHSGGTVVNGILNHAICNAHTVADYII